MCIAIIIVLMLLIVCTTRRKLSMVRHNRIRPIITIYDKGSMTPLTTPGRRSCAQLIIPNSQETTILRPNDI